MCQQPAQVWRSAPPLSQPWLPTAGDVALEAGLRLQELPGEETGGQAGRWLKLPLLRAQHEGGC